MHNDLSLIQSASRWHGCDTSSWTSSSTILCYSGIPDNSYGGGPLGAWVHTTVRVADMVGTATSPFALTTPTPTPVPTPVPSSPSPTPSPTTPWPTQLPTYYPTPIPTGKFAELIQTSRIGRVTFNTKFHQTNAHCAPKCKP